MIPIIINNFNRLSWVQGMLEKIATIPSCYPLIVDNASTYEPLLEWYETKPCEVIRQQNFGHLGPWSQGIVEKYGKEGYVVTDPDLDISDVPVDVLDVLKEGLKKYQHIVKAGLSLEIEDLPDSTLGKEAYGWERQFWRCANDGRFYFAALDTTFALYRGNYTQWTPHFLSGVRAFRPYTARHLPWYNVKSTDNRIINLYTKMDVTDEEFAYRRNSKTASHWGHHEL